MSIFSSFTREWEYVCSSIYCLLFSILCVYMVLTRSLLGFCFFFSVFFLPNFFKFCHSLSVCCVHVQLIRLNDESMNIGRDLKLSNIQLESNTLFRERYVIVSNISAKKKNEIQYLIEEIKCDKR